MKYALVIVEVPEDTWRDSPTAATNNARQVLDKVQSTESTQAIAPDVFLCNMKYGLHDLNTIVATAKVYGFQTRTLFFDEEPSWVVSKI